MITYGKRFFCHLCYMRLILSVAFGLITIVASGGGSGDNNPDDSSNNPGNPPLITDMDISGNGDVLSVFLQWKDPDGDLSLISTYFNNSSGSPLGGFTDEIDDISDTESGIFMGDLNLSNLDAGDYSINLYLTDLKGNESNTMTREFSIEGSFGDEIDYTLTDYTFPQDTAIGDLNGDGRNDVIALVPHNGTILIYYQNLSGGLDNPILIDLEDEHAISLRGVAVADTNNDNRADLVTCTNYDEIVVMLQDSTSGELKPPQIIQSNVISNALFTIADLNGDSLNDLILFEGYSPIDIGTGYAIFYQDINGSLGPGVYTHIDGVSCYDLRIADMNNDGKPDIVTKSGLRKLAVIKQIYQGNFETTAEVYTVEEGEYVNAGFSSFELGDLNGDGLIDAVTVSDSYINILLQNSQGTLNSPVVIQPQVQPFGVEIADITGDGLNDLITDEDGYITVFPQLDDHTFSGSYYRRYNNSSLLWGGSAVTEALSIGDITGDGRLDAVVSWDNEIYVYPYSVEIIIKE